MPQTGYTPIQIYSSSTPTNAPSAGNLTNDTKGSELAINIADKNLFFKDSSNIVNTVPIRQSGAASDGWLSSTDWNTFNNKQPAGAYLTSVTADAPLSGAGTSASHLVIAQATTSTSGYLSSTDWNTFNNKQPAGTYVTSVTGTAPVVSSGGTTPAISMAAATTSVNGYLTSTDWNTFNGKQAALVSGTNIKTVSGTTLLGSGDLGTIGTGYGGTGLTSFTSGGVLYASSTSALTTGTALQFNGTNLALGAAPSGWGNSTAIELPNSVSLFSRTDGPKFLGLMCNAYFNGTNNIYKTSDFASFYYQYAGAHVWLTSTSGTAGNTISFTQVMQTFASGGVSIGNATDPGATNLSVTGKIATGSSLSLGAFTPSTFSAGNAIEIATQGSAIWNNSSGDMFLFANAYYNSGYKYANIGAAARINLGNTDGSIRTYTASSTGSGAGNAITWTTGPYIANGGTSWTNASDERLKDISGEIENALDKVSSLRAIKFTWKSDKNKTPQIGLIAQELQKVIPEVVVVPETELDKEGNATYLGVNYDQVIPLLLAAIKELKVELDLLKGTK